MNISGHEFNELVREPDQEFNVQDIHQIRQAESKKENKQCEPGEIDVVFNYIY